jgi:predicted metal-dependent hydrolase
MNEMKITAAGKERTVHITYKRNRNMYLRVADDGSLNVTCPRYISRAEIAAFIMEKETWIRRTENRQTKREQRHLSGIDEHEAVWLGRRYPVRFEKGRTDFMMIEENEIVFFLREQSQERIEKTFYDYAARQLQAMILERRGEWDREICQKNHIPLPRITLKYMTSRWGSCTPASRHISISKRLIHYPVQCLDYVLLHEYAHLLVPNHSKAFYQVISEYMPDYKESVRLLR